MNKLTVGSSAEKKIKEGVRLLGSKDYPDLNKDNQLVYLYSRSNTFLGTAYLSKQNKGIGWLIADQEIKLDRDFFETLFQRSKGKRKNLAKSDTTTAYRLFNQEGDSFGGLSIDRYGDFALFTWYNTFVYSIKEIIIEAFQQIYPEFVGAYEKVRFPQAGHQSAHLYGKEAPAYFDVLENGVSYSVFLNDGLMTGIFLDQRYVRDRLVNGLALGKRLLNLFPIRQLFQ